MQNDKMALHVDDKDNVATVFAENVTDGTEIIVKDRQGNSRLVTVKGNVPYGHKIATANLKKGDTIMKYGESIGKAAADICDGEYVHIHNMEACRGRGDL